MIELTAEPRRVCEACKGGGIVTIPEGGYDRQPGDDDDAAAQLSIGTRALWAFSSCLICYGYGTIKEDHDGHKEEGEKGEEGEREREEGDKGEGDKTAKGKTQKGDQVPQDETREFEEC